MRDLPISEPQPDLSLSLIASPQCSHLVVFLIGSEPTSAVKLPDKVAIAATGKIFLLEPTATEGVPSLAEI